MASIMAAKDTAGARALRALRIDITSFVVHKAGRGSNHIQYERRERWIDLPA
jgi:hypothetical protein